MSPGVNQHTIVYSAPTTQSASPAVRQSVLSLSTKV